MTKSTFYEKLVGRLQTRQYKQGKVWVLDYRHEDFAMLGRKVEMLRSPYTVGWPECGRPTTDKGEAERWVKSSYTRRIKTELEAKIALSKLNQGPLTVAKACEDYLADLQRIDGHSVHTYRNRKAEIYAHIIPSLGSKPLELLDRETVRKFLESLRVRKQDKNGNWKKRPASIGYQRVIRSTLRAIWRVNLPDIDPPFDGIRLRGPSKSAERRKAAFAGDFEKLLKPGSGAQSPAQLRRTMTGAVWYDRERIIKKPNTSSWAVPNTADSIAFETTTGSRAEELVLLRWYCIREAEGAIVVPGTKSGAAVRILPIQHVLRPWIARMKARIKPAGAPENWEPDPMDFVFITNAKHPGRMGSVRSMSNRISLAQVAAGTKCPGKAQHWARATFATMIQPKVSTEQLKRYLGHEAAFGGATDSYIEAVIAEIPPEHRELIENLPSPEEIEAELADFAPKPLPKRKRKPSRRRKPELRAGSRDEGNASAA